MVVKLNNNLKIWRTIIETMFIVTGRKSEAHKKLNSSSHQTTLLTAAHNFCESQVFFKNWREKKIQKI